MNKQGEIRSNAKFIILILLACVISLSILLINHKKDKEILIDNLAIKLANTPAFITRQQLFNEYFEKMQVYLSKRKKSKFDNENYSLFRENFVNKFGKGIIDTALNHKLWNDSGKTLKPRINRNKLATLSKEWLAQNPELMKLTKDQRKQVFLKAFKLTKKQV